ncbi:MAG TPA: sugar transferase [Armatimonadota bacterium]|nr:sugar transferase [Armatimonadota bacterium]
MGAINRAVYLESGERTRISPWYEPTKRALDMLISGLLLLLAIPLLIPVCTAIVLDSRGPVLFRRRVVGKGGRAFYALKFRTMIENGDLEVSSDSQLAEEYGNNHKLRRDPRVTRVGKVLRKTSIDELPQLINVFLGQMSLVGPRMISFPELEKFGPWQDKILAVKPGITGLWQVNGRSDLPYEDRVRLNVYYVSHRSLPLDLKILAKTIPAVITGRGAY